MMRGLSCRPAREVRVGTTWMGWVLDWQLSRGAKESKKAERRDSLRIVTGKEQWHRGVLAPKPVPKLEWAWGQTRSSGGLTR